MVERLFIHNYKGFVNFGVKFGRTVLLVGKNGSDKSSLLDEVPTFQLEYRGLQKWRS